MGGSERLETCGQAIVGRILQIRLPSQSDTRNPPPAASPDPPKSPILNRQDLVKITFDDLTRNPPGPRLT